MPTLICGTGDSEPEIDSDENLSISLSDLDLHLHFGRPDCGVALPFATRGRLERIFQKDLSGIRVHLGGQAELLGVRAFAHGTDLYFAAGAFEPGTEDGDSDIAHELVHVLQQAEHGLATSDSITFLYDAVQESLAERIAELIRYDEQAARDLIRNSFHTEPVLTLEAVRWDVIQPNVHVEVNGKDYKLTDVDKAMTQIAAGIHDHEIAYSFGHLKPKVRPILKEWIEASRRLVKRFIRGRQERTVRYTSWDSLARALVGEVRSAGSKKTETALAKETVASSWVNDKLEEYLTHVALTLEKPAFAQVKKEIFPTIMSYSKEYGHWYPHGGIKRILREPGKCDLKEKVAGVHDIVSAFSHFDPKYGDVPDDRCVATSLVPNGVRGYRTVKTSMLDDNFDLTFRVGSLRDKDCTLVEDSEIIRSYRDAWIPVGFGPSFTTGRTIQCCHRLCKKTGVPNPLPWINACAWGLFAFWNLYYERRYSRCHTFHEAMDMASNYGIPYSPFRYPSNVPSYTTPYPLGDRID